jgi:hypothetical protein
MASCNLILACLIVTVATVSAKPGFFPVSSQQHHGVHSRQRLQGTLDEDQLDKSR